MEDLMFEQSGILCVLEGYMSCFVRDLHLAVVF